MSKPTEHYEARALTISKWTNLFMAAAGIVGAWLSNSQALLVDGMFSLIAFAAAIFGARVAAAGDRPPDRLRPFGYNAEEAAFIMFRSLSLLVLVTVASIAAGVTIADYLFEGETRNLRFGIMAYYFGAISLTCGLLMFIHDRAWRKSGKTSTILILERQAAGLDGLITLAAGGGLLAIQYLDDTFLAPITPIGDSLVVLLLCAMVIRRYWREFKKGLGELTGVTVDDETVAVAAKIVHAALEDAPGTVVDVAVTKLGRTFDVAVYFSPDPGMSGLAADEMTMRLIELLEPAMGPVRALVIVTDHDRSFMGKAPSEGPRNGVAGAGATD